MSRCQSVAVEVNSSALTGLFGADGSASVREEAAMEVVLWGPHVWSDAAGWRWLGWDGVGGRGRGCIWRGPLGPLNWHVQARGREAGALIRHVTAQSYSLKP